ncbi:MAG: PQQ-dependent sugar dehydrogenase [Daejeonella sp.]
MKKILAFLTIVILFSYSSCKKSSRNTDEVLPDATLDIQVLSQNLSFPWEITWGPDQMIWMTERGGKISRVNPANGSVSAVITVPDVKSTGEGGLLGMALHPAFTANPHDLKLFISTGDAANQPSAQNLSSLSGKILRINLDGSIPSDNPVAGSRVWSYGHRNPQGLVFVNDKLYSSEHGPDKDDEINMIIKNRNFGWPSVNGFCNENGEQSFCSANNVVEPLISWTPTIAVSGMDYYNSNTIPQWKNSIILATLKDQTLYQLKLNSAGDKIEDTKELITNTYGRLRDVCVAPDGKVYVATSNGSNDKIVVITKK